MATVVPILQVIPSGSSSPYTVKKMVHVLRAQGQIEPLQVAKYVSFPDSREDVFITFCEDVHGADIVNAALELGWTSILVVEMPRYNA